MSAARPNGPCPCGSGSKLKHCCRRLHRGAPASTPEALMRSRYSAYALGEVGYLVETTHPDGPWVRADRAAWEAELRASCAGTTYTGLSILETGLDPRTGDPTVTFEAAFQVGGRSDRLRERSRFRRDRGRWKYLDGDPP